LPHTNTKLIRKFKGRFDTNIVWYVEGFRHAQNIMVGANDVILSKDYKVLG
jgi:hypothetical protein